MSNEEEILATLKGLLANQEESLAIQRQAFEGQQKAFATQQTAIRNQLATGRIYRISLAIVAVVIAVGLYCLFHAWR